MNKLINTVITASVVCCAVFVSHVNANDELNAINVAVEEQAQKIDQDYGVLLTTQERQNLKIALVVKKVVGEQTTQTDASVKEITDEAIETYEITDPVEQRKLLIEVEAASYMNGSGTKPPCCQ